MGKDRFPLFLERLQSIVGPTYYDQVVKSFSRPDVFSIRINTFKTTRPEVLTMLKDRNIGFEEISWCPEALILKGFPREELAQMDLIRRGFLYRQGLSSMLPALILDPHPGERILDMCAAPGSKTTQIAAMMRNEGEIVAVEAIRGRYYKLRAVLEQAGVDNASLKLTDGRRFHSPDLFDRVLVDAPCSSEGRFKTGIPETYAYWSPRKIKEMVRKQRGLLLHAARLLKPGGTLVYSTCTFAPEENEGVVDWLLRKTAGTLMVAAINLETVSSYPALQAWPRDSMRGVGEQQRNFDPQVRLCRRVLPDEKMEGFFLARFVKT